jgi:hypothetical protein
MWTTGVQGFDTLPDGNRNEVRQVIADEAVDQLMRTAPMLLSAWPLGDRTRDNNLKIEVV